MKKSTVVFLSIIAGIVVVCGVAMGVGYHQFMSIDAVEYDPQLEILLGGGGNSMILSAEDGSCALVVDTKIGKAAKEMVKMVHADKIIIVNTHAHPDHTGGNGFFKTATIIAGAYTKESWAQETQKKMYPHEVLKTNEEKILKIGSETVHIKNMGVAHTSNDVIVYLENRKILFAGDIVFINKHPILFEKSGCNINTWVTAIDTLMNSFEIKALVPGHGPMSDKSALLPMKEYFVSIKSALGNPTKLTELKEKYKNYYSMPGMSSFDKTVSFISREK